MTNKCTGTLILHSKNNKRYISRVADTTTEYSPVKVLQPEASPLTGVDFALF